MCFHLKCCLQYHPQVPWMVNYKLCNECYKICFAKVLHFQRRKIGDDYIKFYKPRTCTIMQKKTWISFLFKKFFSFFEKFVSSGVSLTNKHVLIIDRHGSHVTLKAILQTQEMGLDMIILSSHTSHDLQPLDVSCLKLVKTTF